LNKIEIVVLASDINKLVSTAPILPTLIAHPEPLKGLIIEHLNRDMPIVDSLVGQMHGHVPPVGYPEPGFQIVIDVAGELGVGQPWGAQVGEVD
jgi:hypothetical protein